MIKTFIPKNIDQLINHIKSHSPSFYFSSQTSTVIPYEFLKEKFNNPELTLVNLSALPKEIKINPDNCKATISGPVTWKDLKEETSTFGFDIQTSPTEELACVLAGVATSCTGERCFHYGNLRTQITECSFLNYEGKIIHLTNQENIQTYFTSDHLNKYQESFQKYVSFKNGPFPRLEKATDLMIGTEGQLGVVTQATVSLSPRKNVKHLFMTLPPWEIDFSPHLEVYEKIQNYREYTLICELTDANSTQYISQELNPHPGKDLIFFEIIEDRFEEFYQNFLAKLDLIEESQIFEIGSSQFHKLRAEIPRSIFEQNAKMKVKKMGTDVQVITSEDFQNLLQTYRSLGRENIKYNMFGHFGDGHLHFNFMPTGQTQSDQAKVLLENLYVSLHNKSASPFAEHGIGLLKKPYIKHFWNPCQIKIFKELKKQFDPHNQFFPDGFMSITNL